MELSSTIVFMIREHRDMSYESMIKDVLETVWQQYIFSEPLDEDCTYYDDNDIETCSRVINGQTVYAVSAYHYG